MTFRACFECSASPEVALVPAELPFKYRILHTAPLVLRCGGLTTPALVAQPMLQHPWSTPRTSDWKSRDRTWLTSNSRVLPKPRSSSERLGSDVNPIYSPVCWREFVLTANIQQPGSRTPPHDWAVVSRCRPPTPSAQLLLLLALLAWVDKIFLLEKKQVVMWGIPEAFCKAGINPAVCNSSRKFGAGFRARCCLQRFLWIPHEKTPHFQTRVSIRGETFRKLVIKAQLSEECWCHRCTLVES